MIFVIFIIIIIWTGFFDNIALNYTNKSLKDAAVVYGSARLINSLISVLQSTDISMVFASVSIGEILDPLNDLIERFSSVMMWGLSSLALQKILITIFSSYPVKLLLTVLSFGMIAHLLLSKSDSEQKNNSEETNPESILNNFSNKTEIMRYNFWKYFLLVIAFKFSLAVMSLMTAGIGIMFTEDKIAKNNEQMQLFSNTLALTSNNFNVDDLQISLNAEKENIKRLIKLKEKKEKNLEDITSKKNELDNRSRWQKIWRSEKNSSVLQVETEELSLERKITNLKHKIEISKGKLSCAEKKLDGKDCLNILTKVKEVISLESFSKINDDFKKVIDSVINLLVLIILNTIILPILFLTLIIYFTKKILKV